MASTTFSNSNTNKPENEPNVDETARQPSGVLSSTETTSNSNTLPTPKPSQPDKAKSLNDDSSDPTKINETSQNHSTSSHSEGSMSLSELDQALDRLRTTQPGNASTLVSALSTSATASGLRPSDSRSDESSRPGQAEHISASTATAPAVTDNQAPQSSGGYRQATCEDDTHSDEPKICRDTSTGSTSVPSTGTLPIHVEKHVPTSVDFFFQAVCSSELPSASSQGFGSFGSGLASSQGFGSFGSPSTSFPAFGSTRPGAFGSTRPGAFGSSRQGLFGSSGQSSFDSSEWRQESLQSICSLDNWKGCSPEEIRLKDAEAVKENAEKLRGNLNFTHHSSSNPLNFPTPNADYAIRPKQKYRVKIPTTTSSSIQPNGITRFPLSTIGNTSAGSQPTSSAPSAPHVNVSTQQSQSNPLFGPAAPHPNVSTQQPPWNPFFGLTAPTQHPPLATTSPFGNITATSGLFGDPQPGARSFANVSPSNQQPQNKDYLIISHFSTPSNLTFVRHVLSPSGLNAANQTLIQHATEHYMFAILRYGIAVMEAGKEWDKVTGPGVFLKAWNGTLGEMRIMQPDSVIGLLVLEEPFKGI